MSVYQRLLLAILAPLCLLISGVSAFLGFEYHFISGQGLIGWLSFPIALVFGYLSFEMFEVFITDLVDGEEF